MLVTDILPTHQEFFLQISLEASDPGSMGCTSQLATVIDSWVSDFLVFNVVYRELEIALGL